jgi:hypothetical protein
MLVTWFPFLRPLRLWVLHSVHGYGFDDFPNYHLRTNAFMLLRETALAVQVPPMRRKIDTYRFESGRQGLTCQILRMGKPVMVVGRDDRAYDRQEWHLSNTFWRRNQENLLVADNQTRAYERADRNLRAAHSVIAWGPEADPAYGREAVHGA